MENAVNEKILKSYSEHLVQEEKSTATCEKYLRDVKRLLDFAEGAEISKTIVLEWKQSLISAGYAPRSINSMLASVNSFFRFMGWQGCGVKNIRLQRQSFCHESRQLTKAEYLHMLEVAGEDEQLKLIMQTVCATGIRISEIHYFTVESVRTGEVMISMKGKVRRVFIPRKLCRSLLRFAKNQGITGGEIFLSGKGKSIDRSCIWRKMKNLARKAGVTPSKVFPHNLRKLFARTFYTIEKDIAKLADILGHSSIDTTRIYIMTTGTEHRRKIERLGLMI